MVSDWQLFDSDKGNILKVLNFQNCLHLSQNSQNPLIGLDTVFETFQCTPCRVSTESPAVTEAALLSVRCGVLG